MNPPLTNVPPAVVLRREYIYSCTPPKAGSNFLHAGDHAHLGYGLTSTRRTNPAVEIEDLPPLDFILLSHLHGDTYVFEVSAALGRT